MTTPDDVLRVHPLFESTAIVLWSLTGGTVAVRKGFDLVGVLVLATVSALGAGLLRDGLLLNRMPWAVSSWQPLALVLASAVAVVVIRKPLARLDRGVLRKGVEVVDAFGTAAYAVVGMQMASAQGFALPGVVLTGVVTGVGGGVLRDLFAGEVPAVLKPGQLHALAVMAGCLLAIGAVALGVGRAESAWVGVVSIAGLRLLAIQFRWETRRLDDGGAPAG